MTGFEVWITDENDMLWMLIANVWVIQGLAFVQIFYLQKLYNNDCWDGEAVAVSHKQLCAVLNILNDILALFISLNSNRNECCGRAKTDRNWCELIKTVRIVKNIHKQLLTTNQ